MEKVTIGSVNAGGDAALMLIAGPCQIEGLDHALMHAEKLAEAAAGAGFGFVYKSSFDKANRTSLGAQRGVGLGRGGTADQQRHLHFRPLHFFGNSDHLVE